MQTSRRQLSVVLWAASCMAVLMGTSGCHNTQKASTQDLAGRIASASVDERREIIQTLAGRGDAAIPEILEAFQKTDKTETQMVLADSVYRMHWSEKRTEALKKMQELAKDANLRRTLEAYVMDPRGKPPEGQGQR